MRILQLTNKSPWPPSEGGPIAMLALRRGLIALGHKVHTITLSTHKFPIDLEQIPEAVFEPGSFDAIDVNTKVRLFPALWCLLTRQSLHVYRFNNHKIRSRLIETLKSKSFDIIIVEPSYMASHIKCIRKHSNAKIVLRAHNIEYKIWERNAQSVQNPIKRWYINSLAKSLERFEKNAFKKFDLICPISETDCESIKQTGTSTKVVCLAFGIDTSNLSRPSSSNAFKGIFYHLGSMDWMPNTEGIRWLIKEVWPQVHKNHPNASLHLAGRNFPEDIQNLAIAGVTIHGEVESATDFIKDKEVLLVPLFSGSGIRIKIIEAMAEGKLIISTEIGAEGIQCQHGNHLLIANNSKEFIACMNSLFENPDNYTTMGQAAFEMVCQQHNYVEAAKVLINSLVDVNNKVIQQ